MKLDTDIVTAVRADLAQRIGHQRCQLWFGEQTQLCYQDQILRIHVPNLFFQEWILANFREELEAACRAVLGICPKLVFELPVHGDASAGGLLSGKEGLQPQEASRSSHSVHQTQSPPGPANICARMPQDAQAEGQCPSGNHQTLPPGQQETRSLGSGGVSCGRGQSAWKAKGGGAVGSRSAGCGCRRRFADFESFITGPSNHLARTAAEMVVASPGVFSPLVLWGPTGVGKTHLLEAIWTAFRRSARGKAAVYLSAEQFTTAYLEALRGSGVPSFRRKYRGVEVLLIDDLQFFAGKKGTQVELLYTIEALQQAGAQLVFAAHAAPRELRDMEADLVARLDSGVVCRIDPPEYETRLGIVARYAERLGLVLPEEVCEFVARHFRRHAWELSGAVCRLHAASCAAGEPITLEFARQVLADMLAAQQQVVRLADIQKAVCEVFQIDPDGLSGPGKARQLAYPRMLAMWLARRYTRAALSEIGKFFGGRSHSTVISAQKQVDRWLTQGRSTRWAGPLANPQEAIRRVEKYLQVG